MAKLRPGANKVRPGHIGRRFPLVVAEPLLDALDRAGRAGLRGDDLGLAVQVIRRTAPAAAMGVVDVAHRFRVAQEVEEAFVLMHRFIEHPERYVSRSVAAVVMSQAGSRGGLGRALSEEAKERSCDRARIKAALIRDDYKNATDKAGLKRRIAGNLGCSVRLVEKVASESGLTRGKARTRRSIAR